MNDIERITAALSWTEETPQGIRARNYGREALDKIQGRLSNLEIALDDTLHIAVNTLQRINPDDISDVRGPEGQHEGEYRLADLFERLELHQKVLESK